jgi:hypothetical protein
VAKIAEFLLFIVMSSHSTFNSFCMILITKPYRQSISKWFGYFNKPVTITTVGDVNQPNDINRGRRTSQWKTVSSNVSRM